MQIATDNFIKSNLTLLRLNLDLKMIMLYLVERFKNIFQILLYELTLHSHNHIYLWIKAQKHQQLVWYKYKNDIIFIKAHGKVNQKNMIT